MSPEIAMVEVGTLWRHIGKGTTYVVVGACQIEDPWAPGVLYMPLSHNHDLPGPIARSLAEFVDGRFVPYYEVMQRPHEWHPSLVGHGSHQCRRCLITLNEAAAIDLLNECPQHPNARAVS